MKRRSVKNDDSVAEIDSSEEIGSSSDDGTSDEEWAIHFLTVLSIYYENGDE